MSNNKKKSPKIIRRIKSLPREIYLLFSISIILILIIELGLKNIEAPIKLFFTIGNIVLNVCFSIVAATIFYYLIQHVPKEEKIVMSSRYITNRLMHFHYEIQYLQKILNLSIRFKTEDLSKEIEYRCSQINPNEEITNNNDSNQIFGNWYDYLDFKTKKFINYLDDILPFYDGMNNDLLESLLNLKDSVRSIQFKLEECPRKSNNLSFLSTELDSLFENHLKSNRIIRVNYKHYWDESNEVKNKENEKRNEEKNDIQLYKTKKLNERLNSKR